VTERPIYETEETKAVELAMVAEIGRRWGCEVVKLPRAYRLDYGALRDKRLLAWLELKRRYRNLTDHDRVFLSLQKVMAAQELNAVSSLPCFLIVQFDDGFFYANILNCGRDARILNGGRVIEFRGRTDRGDWQDQEAVIAIPLRDFREIKPTTNG
jgi:hypothetical protein